MRRPRSPSVSPSGRGRGDGRRRSPRRNGRASPSSASRSRTTSAVPFAVNGFGRSVHVAFERTDAAAGRSAPASPSRTVITTTVRRSCTRRTSRSSSDSDLSSVHCRSSMSTSSRSSLRNGSASVPSPQSSSWRTTPRPKSCSSGEADARRTVTPSACPAKACNSAVLPMPSGPATTIAQPDPSAASRSARATRSSSASRSTRVVMCPAPTRALSPGRPARPHPPATRGAPPPARAAPPTTDRRSRRDPATPSPAGWSPGSPAAVRPPR